MCTVSYIPKDNGFILTSNRDENPLRETKPPQGITLQNGELLTAPIDQENNGTWIAATDKNRVACLLNGAFIKHERNLPYRKSRGLIVLEIFEYESFSDFVTEIDLHNIEPFTLVLAEKDKLQVLIWDEKEKHHQVLDTNKPYLWSSSTLYDAKMKEEKLDFFNTFIEKALLSSDKILELHGLNYDNAFILDRPQVKTVSITQVVVNEDETTMNYNLKKEAVGA
ncbi:hypothetical protein GTQ40_17475 [Flavobacteriaceae bacterium R38]|nr:hypothetical protein [Flavobacteriaceae bacterium R38]